MMDFQPRKLPVFNRVERKTATSPMMKERVAIYKWNGLDGKNIPNSKTLNGKELLLFVRAWDMKAKRQALTREMH